MGQETIYLLLTVALFTAFVLAARAMANERARAEPPIITLAEANGYSFPTGSAAVSSDFASRLRAAVVPRVQEIGADYDARVIEVIGHTDEVPLSALGSRGNLDRSLLPWFQGRDAPALLASDNAGLGMARAVSVARALRSAGLAAEFTVVPLSAGPFLRPDDTVTDGARIVDARERRRIEIRVRRRALRSSI